MKVPSVISTSSSRISPNAATPSTMLCVNARSFDADGATIATRNGPDGAAGPPMVSMLPSMMPATLASPI